MPRTIRIHIWGGLGSQLYALALLLDLKKRYPSKKFKCMFHTGGVTERLPEIINLLDGLASYSVIYDFKGKNRKENYFGNPQSNFQIGFPSPRRWGFKLLLTTGLVSDCNESTKVFPWTFGIRGHYRTRALTQESLQTIASLIQEKLPIRDHPNNLVIHFRLGDLVGLKDTISPSRLALAVQSKFPIQQNSRNLVYSDSPDLAREQLASLLNIQQFPSQDIWLTLIDCINSRIFVGTISKISYWAIYLRLNINADSISMIPVELKDDLDHSLGSLSSYSNLKFY